MERSTEILHMCMYIYISIYRLSFYFSLYTSYRSKSARKHTHTCVCGVYGARQSGVIISYVSSLLVSLILARSPMQWTCDKAIKLCMRVRSTRSGLMVNELVRLTITSEKWIWFSLSLTCRPGNRHQVKLDIRGVLKICPVKLFPKNMNNHQFFS